MKKYNDIIVGSGISGLSLSLLLGLYGRKVLLIEKAPQIGGSLCRFYKQGIPFDTGFHFSGGLNDGGMFSAMLKVLGIKDSIKPLFLTRPQDSQYIFEEEDYVFSIPPGGDNLKNELQKQFPQDAQGVEKFFYRMKMVCEKTSTMDMSKIAMSPESTDEDFVTLQAVLDELIKDKLLQAVLSVYTLCYGTSPKEISFSNHARAALALYESVAMVDRGGDAFIQGFKEKFKNIDIDIICNCELLECANIEGDCAKSFVLSNGQTVEADCAIFTIHPQKVLEILPKKYLSKAFIDRVGAFEPSMGFFSVFCALEGEADCTAAMATLFPFADINKFFETDYAGMPALAVARKSEQFNGKVCNTLNAFAMCHFNSVEKWKDSDLKKRPQDYYDFKAQEAAAIMHRLELTYPQYLGRLKVMDSSSMLTFRDYSYSPDGCAYGIKQRIGQYNLFGKLPIRNLYACGQSSVLPGVLGAMLSSFVVARSIIGKDDYGRFINSRL
jgi:all-trans-retinol 13,14-reductase